MGRPSLAETRRLQILDGIARCVGLHGLADSTQELMAAESGFSRSHIRHYLGNRDQILDAVWDYTVAPYRQQMAQSLEADDPADSLRQVLEFLFGPQMASTPDSSVIDAMINGAVKHPQLSKRVYATYHELEQQISVLLRRAAPDMPRRVADGLAFSILSMSLGASTLSSMQFPRNRRRSAFDNARRLIDAAVRTPSGHGTATVDPKSELA